MRKVFNNKTIEHIINALFLLDVFFLISTGIIAIHSNYPLIADLLGLVFVYGFFNFIGTITYKQ